jgi:thioredoxin-like negative regulator of GroEL
VALGAVAISQYSDQKFYFLDVDLNRDHMQIVMNLGIKKVPYFVLFKDGLVVNQCEGEGSDKIIRRWLAEHGCTPNPITQTDVAERAVNTQIANEAEAPNEKEAEDKKDE